MTPDNAAWDEDAIVVVPGLPGNLSRPEGDRPTYPASTLTFVKVLRGEGYTVRIATPDDMREVSHHGADDWLPVANFGLQVLSGGAGNVLAGILLHYFGAGRERKKTAHIRWNVQEPNGAVREFSFDGDSEAAVEAARAFERSLGYGEKSDE